MITTQNLIIILGLDNNSLHDTQLIRKEHK